MNDIAYIIKTDDGFFIRRFTALETIFPHTFSNKQGEATRYPTVKLALHICKRYKLTNYRVIKEITINQD